MKAFLNRINRGLSSRGDRDKEAALREKIPQLAPLPEWPPQRATSTPSTLDSSKPLPELSIRPLPPIEEPEASGSASSSATPTPIPPLPLTDSPDDERNIPSKLESTASSQSRSEPDSAGRSSRKTTNGSTSNGTNNDVHKKVAFLSPPPTPGPNADRDLPEAETPTSPGGAPLKTTVSRFQATHVKDTRGSTSTATSSRTDVASTTRSAKQSTARATTSPYPGKSYGDSASIHQSLRSGTPYSQTTNASSRILAAQSWSEIAEEDLVSNIGQRERTRQEVLWEIVASEERYVNEIIKMKETFIDPLLHPYSAPTPVTSPTPLLYDEFPRSDTPRESLDHLPIAARFLSPVGFRSDSPTGASPSPPRKDEGHPNIDGESLDSAEEDEANDRMGATYHSRQRTTAGMSQAAKHSHPRSPYNARSGGGRYGTSVPFPSRSHQSLPPPPRMNGLTASTHSLGRQSFIAERERDYSGESSQPSAKATSSAGSNVLRKFKRSNTARDVVVSGVIPQKELPEDLRKCLEVIETAILEGHVKLSGSLKKRYEEQYPLVRSLADVFVANSHILQGYATYVLHLERALEQVDNALSNASPNKKPKKQDADQWAKICQTFQRLEVIASEKGETGLAISLSKPFQRLLKYPLLFQNLLYHTDPSTFEYEATLQMVAEVESIVRSIEDEKIQKEERDKTRDVFARIEGLDKVKQLMVPKPSRVLMEERPVLGVNPEAGGKSLSTPPGSSSSQVAKGVRGKTSFKRLSDVLQPNNGVGGKKDQWLVVFNDVVLRCQRTGTTSLPLVAATNSRTNSLPDLQGKTKYATTGRRGLQTKPRNLYKFIKIETWAIGDVVKPREGVVSMEDVVKSRQQAQGVQPRIVPLPDDEEDGGVDSDDSDRKSKMSFSYWGADKVTIQKPTAAKRQLANTARRGAVGAPTAYARESSANAKFGTRLIATESPNGARPASRRTQATPTNRRQPPSDESNAVKATITRDRPGWNGSTRATPVPKRPRNTSQTSTATRTASAKQLVSPAPSEDSGVGLYRQIIAQNPSLNALNANA